MNFLKKYWPIILVLIWVVFSLVYILNDFWSDFKEKRLLQAYEQGRTDTINTVITEAEKCQPFSVFSGEKQIQLMNLGCPQQPAK